MGCGASLMARPGSTVPADVEAVLVRESYEKVLMSPGGTVTKVLGYCIDTTLPRSTPGGSAAARRDYDRDPLTFEEVRAIEAARERARYLAETPKMLGSSWRKIVLQAPDASTPTSDGLSAEGARSIESERTGSGRREIRVPLVRHPSTEPHSTELGAALVDTAVFTWWCIQPADCAGGEELVVETPRGTLVDVTVPSSIEAVSPDRPPRVIAVLYHPNPHAAIPTPTTPTPIILSSPPKGKKCG